MTDAPRITSVSWLMIAVLAFTWGGTFLITELALEGITPFWLAAGRTAFGMVATFVVWRLAGGNLFHVRPTPVQIAALLAVGAFSSAVPFMLLAWGQQYVTGGFAGVSMAAVALIILPLAHVFVPGERMTRRRAVGFGIGFAGVVVLIGSQAFESTGAVLELPGRIACLMAACCYACSSILMRRLPPVDVIGLSCVLLMVATCITVPTAWIAEGPPPLPDTRTLWIIIFLGLVPTGAANLLRVTVVRTAGPVFMSLTNYQVPVWSVLLGAWLLNEPLPPALIYAMALILSGVAISQYGALRRLFGRG